MITYERMADNGKLGALWDVAERALRRYGLQGASLTLVGGDERTVFQARFPDGEGAPIHPYLGRLAGKGFILRVQPCTGESAHSIHAELTGLAALLRDTDLEGPEPVPACDGALYAKVEAEGADEVYYCVLMR